MTTVSEFIAYLQTLPPETTVEVLEEDCSGYSNYVFWTDLTLPSDPSYGCADTLYFSAGSDKYGPSLEIGKR
jgi:hypothetical protein